MFQFSESNLAKAGTILILEHMVGMAIGLILAHLQVDDRGLIFIGIWLANIAAAWFLYRAALAQGRPRAKWYGVGSALAPVIALLVFMILYLQDRLDLIAGAAGVLKMRPNSSFKPSPLRGLGQNLPFSGGPA